MLSVCGIRQPVNGVSTLNLRDVLTPVRAAEQHQHHPPRDHSVWSPLEQDEIRLLYLHSYKSASEELSCSLVNTPLSTITNETRPYTALSYCWESPFATGTRTILVNGCSYTISRNLHDALDQFVTQGYPEVLWVDALCINQNDVQEKNHLVGHMGEIYRHAELTIAWLGRYNCQLFDQHGGLTMDAIGFLDNCCYFNRAWTFQECVIPENLIIQCASMTASWHLFASACSGSRDSLPKRLLESITVIDLVRGEQATLSLVSLLCAIWTREATDKRDKINAVLGICRTSHLKANYKFTLRTTLISTAGVLVETDGPRFLCLAGQIRSSESDRDRLSLPSWVPPWHNSKPGSQRLRRHSHFSRLHKLQKLEKEDSMFTLGRDNLAFRLFIKTPRFDPTTESIFVDAVILGRVKSKKDASHFPNQAWVLPLPICCNLAHNGQLSELGTIGATREDLQKVLSKVELHDRKVCSHFLATSKGCIKQRRQPVRAGTFISTVNVPIEENDWICWIPGMSSEVFLRPRQSALTAGSDVCGFELVGDNGLKYKDPDGLTTRIKSYLREPEVFERRNCCTRFGDLNWICVNLQIV